MGGRFPPNPPKLQLRFRYAYLATDSTRWLWLIASPSQLAQACVTRKKDATSKVSSKQLPRCDRLGVCLLLQNDGARGDPIAVAYIAHPQLQEVAGP